MENVYRIKSGDLINIKTKFTEFKNSLCPKTIDQLPQTYEDVKSLLDIPNVIDEDELEDSISLNNLAQLDDIPIADVKLHEFHSKPGQLRSMRYRVEADMAAKTHGNVPKKYNRYRYIEHKTSDADEKLDLVPFDDILITVRVYEPFTYKRGGATKRKPRLSQEFFVLGRQKLIELRDKIYCHCQFGPFKDISNDFESIQKTDLDSNNEEPATKAADPGFFFITDTFYNDHRASSTDYSTEIREWMTRQSDFGPVQVKSMDDTKFEDLTLRVGFPQLYRHYVNCEHVISFTDIRLLAPDDPLKSSDYPLLRCISNSKMTLCGFCGIKEATFAIKNSTVLIHNPSFLCRECFISFHYVDGKKVGTFQAFRYYGNRPVINCVIVKTHKIQIAISHSCFIGSYISKHLSHLFIC